MLRPAVFCLLLSLGFTASAADFSGRFEELKRTISPAQLYALLYDLPKGGDLHNHSSGSEIPEWMHAVLTNPARTGGDSFYTRARISTEASALAPGVRFRTIRQRTYDQLSPVVRAEYVPLAQLTPAEKTAWLDAFRLDAPGEGRTEFFQGIWSRRGDISQNLTARLELFAENIKAFAAEGVRYLETQFTVDNAVALDGRAIPPAEVAAAVRQRLAGADLLATGLTVRLQDTVIRFRPDAEAKLAETYAFVDAHRDLWVGINLAGIEEDGRGFPRRFLQSFRQLRSLYPTLPLSIHAGEMDGPNSHVRDTLLLGASRLGHAVNLIHDEDTLLLLQQHRRVLVEVSLISNRLLGYTPDLTLHPFPEYLRTGVPVCLNTDDRGMWDSNLTDEYYTAVTTFRLSWPEIVALGRHSLVHAFVQPEVKAKLLADYETRVAAFAEKYGTGPVAEAVAKVQVLRPVAYGYARRTWGFVFSSTPTR